MLRRRSVKTAMLGAVTLICLCETTAVAAPEAEAPPSGSEGEAAAAAPAAETEQPAAPVPPATQPPPEPEPNPPAPPPDATATAATSAPAARPEAAMPARPATSDTKPATPADSVAEEEELPVYSRAGTWLALELGAGMNLNGRFGTAGEPSESDDSADTLLGAAAHFVLDGRWAIGVAYDRAGYGKERFPVASDGSTLNVAYDVDAFWVSGRYFFSDVRPAPYARLGLGLGVPRARATGISNAAPQIATGTPFECGDAGRVGAGALLAVGLEADLSGALSFLTELQGSGHLLDGDEAAHGRCGVGEGRAIPGAGTSVQGALRVALAYRFSL
jgi:hypothetical protein